MVPEAARKAGPYVGNSVATSFAFAFKVFAKTDLRVVLATTASGLEVDLVLDSDFSVTLNVDQDVSPGGSITYPISGSPMASTETLTIVSDLIIKQPLDITNLGGFFPQTQEDAFDRAVMLIGQVQEEVERSMTLPVSVASGVSAQIPLPQASQLLGWDGTGTELVNYAGLPNSVTLPLDIANGGTGASTANTARAALLAAGPADNVTWAGTQTFNDGKVVLKGATSGSTTLKAAAVAGSGTATLPTGTSTLAGTNVKQSFTAQQTPFATTKTYAATITWDGDTDGQVIAVTATGNPTFGAPTGIVQYAMYMLRFTQDGTGNRVASWNAAYKFGTAGAPTLTTTASKTDWLMFVGGSSNTLEYIGCRLDAV